MKEIILNLPGQPCVIYVDRDLRGISEMIPAGKLIIITDQNVYRLYGQRFPDVPVIVLEPGEQSKELGYVPRIYEELVRAEADRNTFILGIGGGVVCDITGFVASTYMRGVSFGFIATTLLAQVDASIGGKNGVNLRGYKNLVGVVRQPEFIICALEMLDTLSHRDYLDGFAEIIKYGAIRDRHLFDSLADSYQAVLSKDRKLLRELVARCVEIKCQVVEADQFEQSERKVLNFGHTFGHALEKLYRISHGEAVSIGMEMAVRVSIKSGLLDAESGKKLTCLIEAMGLPLTHAIDYRDMLEVIRVDKKRAGDMISLILLDELGHAVIRDFSFKDLNTLIHDLYQPGKQKV